MPALFEAPTLYFSTRQIVFCWHLDGEAFEAAESFEYDPQILKQVRSRVREGRACALDRVARQPERGFEEKPVEIRPPCCLLVGGDESHCHLLTKHLSEKPRDASDRGEAVRVLALEREHECIDGSLPTDRAATTYSDRATGCPELQRGPPSAGRTDESMISKTFGSRRMSV